eukprot:GSMAST32.ASY1.ANO1.1934.1 assembled CDS
MNSLENRKSACIAFQKRGFISIDQLVEPTFAEELNVRLERVLRGEYDTGITPDKIPKRIKPGNNGVLGFSGNPIKRTLQIINIWKSDSTFAKLVLSPTLGQIVATLGGWKYGARIAQDQVWAKPPGASSLVFHRDSPYFDFCPNDVITVWIALDDMTQKPSIGPLEYAVGSHLWGDGRSGSANQFFQDERRRLLDSAALLEGIDPDDVEIVTVKVCKGGCSIHNGKTWHGSGPNTSSKFPRRGLGIHFIPANAEFKEIKQGERPLGKLWLSHKSTDSNSLPSDVFPITFSSKK